jgi:hypothetical protein
MKRRILSILAVVGLLMMLATSLATPVMAITDPKLNSVTNALGKNFGGYNSTMAVTFTGTFTHNPTAVTVYYNGAVDPNVSATFNADNNGTTFTGTIVTPLGSPHGPRDITVTTSDGISAVLYSAWLVGQFPFPIGKSGTQLGSSLTPFYDPAGGSNITTFNIATPPTVQVSGPVAENTTIWFQVTLTAADVNRCYFLGGQLDLRFPHNPANGIAYIPIAGYGLTTTPLYPDIPEVNPTNILTVWCTTPYTVHAADMIGGSLLSEADYGQTTDSPTQQNGVVEDSAGTALNQTITGSMEMLGNLRVNKSVVYPGGFNSTGINGSFLVTVTGPNSYSNILTFTVTGGACTPAFYDLNGLAPGIYTVSETPGSPWNVAITGISGQVGVLSGGSVSSNVTNAYVPGSLTVSKVVNMNGVSGTGINQNFSVTVTGPNSFSQVLTFVVTNGQNPPSQTLTNLVPGAYTVTETNPGSSWTFSVSNSGAVTVNSGSTASSIVTNNYVVPHTSLVGSVTANTTTVPKGGGNVTITVTDTNDGTVQLTGVYFTLSGVPQFLGGPINMTRGADIVGNNDAFMDPGDVWRFTASVPISQSTILTAVGHGTGNGVDVTGLSETGSVSINLPPPVPASSNLGIGILIVGLAGAVTFFGWQRRRRSQQ